jgi:hypothetical protein
MVIKSLSDLSLPFAAGGDTEAGAWIASDQDIRKWKEFYGPNVGYDELGAGQEASIS